LTLEAGKPVPFSAAEEVFRLIQLIATVVIMNPTGTGLYFAIENTDNGWLDTADLQQCIRDLGTDVGVDGLDLSAVVVEKVPYILGDTILSGLGITDINGQDKVTLIDDVRMKTLTVSEQDIVFADDRARNLDWIDIGEANHASSGYIADYDGTVVSVSGHCALANGNEKEFRMVIGDPGTETVIGTLGTADNDAFSSTILDVDFIQGDMIRVRAYDGTGGAIRDVVIKITMKWRG